MGLFSSIQLNSMDDLLCHQLMDLYDAEIRLTKALPKMVEAAASSSLKSAFSDHLGETKNQVKRLEQIFAKLGKKPEAETCPAMKGLIQEGEEMINAEGDPSVRDAALIAAAQRVEHYEIAGYGTARTIAEELGLTEVAELLQATLDEEFAADKKLTNIAVNRIHSNAMRANSSR